MSHSRRRFLKHTVMTALASSLAIRARGGTTRPRWVTGNEKIDRARQVAIDMLKPTQKQLQHAWELHFNSLVFESYGFAPRCAIDGARIQAAVKAGASPSEIGDIREETMMNRGATHPRERAEFLAAVDQTLFGFQASEVVE